MAWTSNIDLIQKLYIAFYGRPADPGGLRYWASQLPDNATPNSAATRELISRFINSQEAQERFGSPFLNSTIVRVYTYAFRRDATDADKAKYAGKTVVDVLVDVLSVSYGPDYGTLNEKLQYAKWFTNYLDPNGDGIPNDDSTGTKFAATFYGNTDAETAKSKLHDIWLGNPAVQSKVLDDVRLIADTGDYIITNPPVTGQTFTLTTGVDNIVGTSGDDTIIAYINTTTGSTGQTTLTGADVINGGGGTDTLNLTVEGANAAGSLPAATITNVENFFIRDLNTFGPSTYNFAIVAGEKQVWNDRSTQAVTFNNLGTGTTVGVKGDNANNVSATTFTMATATDPVTIAIDGGVKGSPNITRNQTGQAAVTITSTGAANAIGNIDLDTGAAIKSVTIDAATKLTALLDAADYAAGATLTLKGAGFIDLSGAALAANITTVNAAGSTGGVSVVMGANTTSFTGGAGDDTVNAGAFVFNSTGSLNGGGGTNTLVLQDEGQLTAATVAKMKNFQVLRLNDDNDDNLDTFDSSLMSGLTGLVIGAQSAGDGVSVTNMSAALAGNVTIAGNQVVGPTFGVTGATTVGQLDTLSIKIDDGLAAKNTLTVANITAAGVETIKVVTVDNLTLQSATGLTAMTKMEFSGSGNVNVTTGALALNANTIIDASALTGTFTFDASAATTNGLAIIGSSTKANTITGTNQADVITGGAANDTITHGNGIDTINISQGGDDIIVMEGIVAAANRAVVTGFTAGTYVANSGVDRLEMSSADVTTPFGTTAANLQEVTSAPNSALTFSTSLHNVLELAFELAGNGTANDLDNHTDGTGLLNSLGQTVNVSGNNHRGYIVAYQDGKAYLFYASDTGDAVLTAGEIQLVGVFNGVSVGAFTASNFINAV